MIQRSGDQSIWISIKTALGSLALYLLRDPASLCSGWPDCDSNADKCPNIAMVSIATVMMLDDDSLDACGTPT